MDKKGTLLKWFYLLSNTPDTTICKALSRRTFFSYFKGLCLVLLYNSQIFADKFSIYNEEDNVELVGINDELVINGFAFGWNDATDRGVPSGTQFPWLIIFDSLLQTGIFDMGKFTDLLIWVLLILFFLNITNL